MRSDDRLPTLLLVLVLATLVVSGIGPRDRLTWWLEVAPIVVAVPLLAATRRRFPMTPLVYVLVAAHAAVLALGGHHTYAEVPLGFWVRDLLGLARNPYDRLGHFMQGFVPALVVREVLLRTSPLRRGGWLFVLTTAVVLSLSAIYEFVEWGAALVLGQGADAFLGMQGDPWDTQWDMFLCFVGGMLSQLLLARAHDRQLARLAPDGGASPPYASLPAGGEGSMGR
jgi:putative membrane protein